MCSYVIFFCKQKTAYEMRISDWSSDVCSSDLLIWALAAGLAHKMISILPPPIETRIIEELKTPDEPPPPPPPPALDLPPPPFVPPPAINIATPAPKHAIRTPRKAPAATQAPSIRPPQVRGDRKRAVDGKSVTGRVDLGVRRPNKT